MARRLNRPCRRCPQLTRAANGLCDQCHETHGKTNARGYDARHKRLREHWRPIVAAGNAPPCWRCGQPIQPTDDWDLGHHPTDRTKYRGPEHRSCNRRGNRTTVQ